MRILVLGGTAWLGGEVARQALEQGHSVTCLARGAGGLGSRSGATFVAADRDLPDGIRAGQRPGLGPRRGRHAGSPARSGARSPRWPTGPSTGSSSPRARSTPTTRVPGPDETRPLLPAARGRRGRRRETYGEAKVACEQACRGGRRRLLLARAGLIVGYGDRSDRFGYWPGRMALAARDGGPVLVPAGQDAPAQFLDVGDLARWLVDAGAAGVTGTVDAVGPRRTLARRPGRRADGGRLHRASWSRCPDWLLRAGRSRSTWGRGRCRCGSPTRTGPGSPHARGAAAAAAGLTLPAAGRPGGRQPAVGARAGPGPHGPAGGAHPGPGAGAAGRGREVDPPVARARAGARVGAPAGPPPNPAGGPGQASDSTHARCSAA